MFTRLLRRLFGEDKGGIRYYLMGGGSGPETAGLDIGAPVGTDVYAPVDGTVIGITDLHHQRPAVRRAHRHPAFGQPGPRRLADEPASRRALTVGSSVAAAATKIGSVIDLSSVETSALARYTQDRGQHVHLEVRPTASSRLPLRILFVADVFGVPGRRAVETRLRRADDRARDRLLRRERRERRRRRRA